MASCSCGHGRSCSHSSSSTEFGLIIRLFCRSAESLWGRKDGMGRPLCMHVCVLYVNVNIYVYVYWVLHETFLCIFTASCLYTSTLMALHTGLAWIHMLWLRTWLFSLLSTAMQAHVWLCLDVYACSYAWKTHPPHVAHEHVDILVYMSWVHAHTITRIHMHATTHAYAHIHAHASFARICTGIFMRSNLAQMLCMRRCRYILTLIYARTYTHVYVYVVHRSRIRTAH